MTNKQSMHILYEVNLHNSEVKKLISFQLNFFRKKKTANLPFTDLLSSFQILFLHFKMKTWKKNFASKHLIYKLF